MKDLRLEFVVRLRYFAGSIAAEYIIRGEHVECINYWPSGVIRTHGTITLEQFITETEAILKEKARG